MTDAGVLDGEGQDGTSTTLLASIKAKDQEAWRRLMLLYSPLVDRWCRRFGLREADTADVVQEVFRTVAVSIDDFHHDQGGDSFRGWLRTITRSRVIDFQRRKGPGAIGVGGSEAQARLVEVEAASWDSEPAEEEADQQLLVRRAVDLVLGNCKEESRLAFWRVVIAGQHPADVARDLGLTVNAVYLAKSHLLRRIRDELAELVDI